MGQLKKSLARNIPVSKANHAPVKEIPRHLNSNNQFAADFNEFASFLLDSGLKLSFDCDNSCMLKKDSAVFVRILNEKLINCKDGIHDISWFLHMLEAFLDEINLLQVALNSTYEEADENCDENGCNRDSFLRFMLLTECIQTKVASMLLEKVAQFSIDSNLKHATSSDIPRLILNQFRYLDFVIDSEFLCNKLLEMTTACDDVVLQRDMLGILPELITDDQHYKAALQLKELLIRNSGLTAAILDTMSNLRFEGKDKTEMVNFVIDQISFMPKPIIPMSIQFLVNSCLTSSDATTLFMKLHDKFDFDRIFFAQKSPLKQSDRQQLSEEECAEIQTAEVFINNMKRKHIFNGALKMLSELSNLEINKTFDFILMLALHSSNRNRPISTLMRNRIRVEMLNATVLDSAFRHSHVMCLFSKTITDLCEQFTRSNYIIVSRFGASLYQHAFGIFDFLNQQEIVGLLLSHVGSSVTEEINAALAVLSYLAEKHAVDMSKFSLFITSAFDYLDHLSTDQIELLFSAFGQLAFSTTNENELLKNELNLVIQKNSSSSKLHYQTVGVVGSLVLLEQAAKNRRRLSNNDVCSETDTEGLLLHLEAQLVDAPYTQSLYYDHLSALLQRRCFDLKYLNDLIKKKNREFRKLYFSDNGCMLSRLPFETEFWFPVDSSQIYLNLLPVVFNSGLKSKTDDRSTVGHVASMIALFRLIWVSHIKDDASLNNLRAFIESPILSFKVSLLDNIARLAEFEKNLLCSCLYYMCNWTREVLNAVCHMPANPNTLHLGIVKLRQMIEAQRCMALCLQDVKCYSIPTAKYNLIDCKPQIIYNADQTKTVNKAKAKMEKRKLPGKVNCIVMKKKKTRGSECSDDICETKSGGDHSDEEEENQCQIRPEFVATVVNNSFMFLKDYQHMFGELDLEVLMLLKIPLRNDESDDNCILPLELLYLLDDMIRKLTHALPSVRKASIGIKNVSSKKSSAFPHLDAIPQYDVAYVVSTLSPYLVNHMIACKKHFEGITTNKDGVIDSAEMWSADSLRLICCLDLLFSCLTSFLSWHGLKTAEHRCLLDNTLDAISRQLTNASRSSRSMSSVDVCWQWFFEFNDFCFTSFNLAVSLLKLLCTLIEHGTSENFKDLTAGLALRCLTHEWTMSGFVTPAKGVSYRDSVVIFLQTYLSLQSDVKSKLNAIEDVTNNGVAKLALNSDCSPKFPTLTKATQLLFYRSLMEGLVVCIGKIPCELNDLNEVDVAVKRWVRAIRIFSCLVMTTREFHSRPTLSVTVRSGRHFVEAFMRSVMPVFDHHFLRFHADIRKILACLQTSTKQLQHVCNFVKKQRDVVVLRYVPTLRKTLEEFVFRVKAMLTLNNCQDAFWMGNLRHRNLKGEDIFSQGTFIYDDDDLSGEEKENVCEKREVCTQEEEASEVDHSDSGSLALSSIEDEFSDDY